MTLHTEGSRRARLTNISRSGLLVRSREAPKVGSRLELEIRTRGAKPMPLQGEVVRVLPASGEEERYEVALRLFAAPPSSLFDTDAA